MPGPGPEIPYTGRTGTQKQVVRTAIGYVAEGTVVTQLLSINKTADTGALADQTQQTPDPKSIEIKNTGKIPVIALLGYEGYSNATTTGAVHYLQTLIKPGQTIVPPLRGIIPFTTADHGQVYDGTVVDFADTAIMIDSGTTLTADLLDSATTLSVADGSIFRVNDLIQVGINAIAVTKIEIMRVVSKTDPAGDGLYTPSVLTVERKLFGTELNDASAQTNGVNGSVTGAKVYFPFFNEYQDHDRYTTPQTDGGGRFKAKNLYGHGRTPGSLTFGITPGSLVIKWYSSGYQNLTDDGDIGGGTDSGLSADTYYMSISIDGKTADAITFTVGTNTKFLGSDGVVAKMQAAIDALYYDPSKNSYELRATVSVVDGNVRITSGQRTATSAILISTNTAGTGVTDELFDGTNSIGRFGGSIPGPVTTKLPDDVIYDPITYQAVENIAAFCYDDGNGGISGAECTGNINYETGAISIAGPINADFVFTVAHSGPFSGMQDATQSARANGLTSVLATVQNRRMSGELEVSVS